MKILKGGVAVSVRVPVAMIEWNPVINALLFSNPRTQVSYNRKETLISRRDEK